jgi:hypothetical protein
MGQGWNSGLYGGFNTNLHIPGAWQIYQHSGDLAFLRAAYDFYTELFDNDIGIRGEGLVVDTGLGLALMASELGYSDEVAQNWRDKVSWLTNVRCEGRDPQGPRC